MGAYCYEEIRTPLGSLVAIANDKHQLSHLLFDAEVDRRAPFVGVRRQAIRSSIDLFMQLGEQLEAYFAGASLRFSIALAPEGTAFQQQVWQALARIAPGETRTYGYLATELGRPRAARAVGAANARNPISILIPCHRLVGANGALTGYAGGMASKRWLLAHEARWAGRAVRGGVSLRA